MGKIDAGHKVEYQNKFEPKGTSAGYVCLIPNVFINYFNE